MIYILSKALLFIIKPIVWICILLIWAIFSKVKRHKKRLVLSSLLLLYFCSNSFLVGKLFNAYEADYPIAKKYDVGIVLGGFAGENKRNHQIEFGPAGDRLMQGLKLLKNGSVKKLLISGGNAFLTDNQVKESDLTIQYLHTIGIPDSLILLENRSRNTIENAKYSKELLDSLHLNKPVLVISSAWHLPRVKMLFNKQFGAKASYYPTQFMGKMRYDFDDYVIPDPEAFQNLHFLIKEWVGLLADRIRA